MRPKPIPTMPREVRVAKWWLYTMGGIALILTVVVFVLADDDGAYQAGGQAASMLPVLVGPLLGRGFATGTNRLRVGTIVCASLMIFFALRAVAEGYSIGLLQIAGGIVLITQLACGPAKQWFARPAAHRV